MLRLLKSYGDLIVGVVRYLTPNNVPSACSGTHQIQNLIVVPDTVIPMQRSEEWWKEAHAFHRESYSWCD